MGDRKLNEHLLPAVCVVRMSIAYMIADIVTSARYYIPTRCPDFERFANCIKDKFSMFPHLKIQYITGG